MNISLSDLETMVCPHAVLVKRQGDIVNIPS